MEMECSGVVRGSALHPSIQLSLLGPPSVEVTTLWEEIDIKFPTRSVAYEVPSINRKRLGSHDAIHPTLTSGNLRIRERSRGFSACLICRRR